jgi:hypothetical protein
MMNSSSVTFSFDFLEDHNMQTTDPLTYSKYFAEAKTALNRLVCPSSQPRLDRDAKSVKVFVNAYSTAYAHLDRLYFYLKNQPDDFYYCGKFPELDNYELFCCDMFF